jgi:hypothetical protein
MLIFKGTEKPFPLEVKMPGKSQPPQIPLPKSWDIGVKSAILHIVALAQYALAYSRSWAADSTNQRVRLQAENDRLRQELSLREDELRIKDIRMAYGEIMLLSTKGRGNRDLSRARCSNVSRCRPERSAQAGVPSGASASRPSPAGRLAC